jgi:large subunit ribosomal protein L32
MPTPKRKLSRRRRDMRSANKGIKVLPFSLCQTPHCQSTSTGHAVCNECGMYKGKQIIAQSHSFKAKMKEVEKKNNM